MQTFRRIRRTIAAVLLVLSLPGCGDSGGPEGIAGTYTLQTVNGEGPPWWADYSYEQVEVDGKLLLSERKRELVSETLRMNANGTCSWTKGWRVTEARLDPVTHDVVSATVDTVTWYNTDHQCTYTVTGNSVTLTHTYFLPMAVSTGTFAGDVLTIDYWFTDGEMVYER